MVATDLCLQVSSLETLREADIVALLRGNNDQVILAGNLNAKHSAYNSRKANCAGRTFLTVPDRHRFIVDAPKDFTHFQFDLCVAQDFKKKGYSGDHAHDVLDVISIRNLKFLHKLTT